jgi:hypothetical protein
MKMEALQEELISFMFLRDANDELDVMRCLGLWFGKSNGTVRYDCIERRL